MNYKKSEKTKQIMKIIKLFSFAVLLALVATSCSKDDGARKFRLFANPIRNASKIQMNPVDLTSSWVAGEKINLNGQECVITESNSIFSIECQNVPTTPIYAIYPYTSTTGDNVITTIYDGETSTMKLKQLAINFNDDYSNYQVIFPMAAKTEENTGKLMFDHLTAGFKITIENTATEACTLSAIRVFAQCPNAESTTPETYNGVSVSWEHQGLIVPSGPIGGINGDVALQNACEMFFKMKSGNNDYVVIPAANQQNGNGSISFCIPATVRAISSITVTGVGADGADVFARTMSSSNANVARNNMYAIPTITIPVQTQPQSK